MSRENSFAILKYGVWSMKTYSKYLITNYFMYGKGADEVKYIHVPTELRAYSWIKILVVIRSLSKYKYISDRTLDKYQFLLLSHKL